MGLGLRFKLCLRTGAIGLPAARPDSRVLHNISCVAKRFFQIEKRGGYFLRHGVSFPESRQTSALRLKRGLLLRVLFIRQSDVVAVVRQRSRELRPTIISIPPICGSRANRMSLTMAKSSGAGRSMPREPQATSLIAASV